MSLTGFPWTALMAMQPRAWWLLDQFGSIDAVPPKG